MPKPTIAVAIPAHDEAEALEEFLVEIQAALAPRVERVTFVVVDDASHDDTSGAARKADAGFRAAGAEAEVVVVRHEVNRGHGPTVLEAYRTALETGADFVLQVDGDGQFLGSDLRRLTVLLEDGAEAVSGVRRFRYDPWFRMAMTRVVRWYVALGFGVPTRDANCPLRGYEASLLDDLLRWVPAGARVPNLYLTILAARRGSTMVEVDVNHRVRRGSSATGTMWSGGRRRPSPIPLKLLRFSGAALAESVGFHRAINRGRRPDPSAGRS